MVRITWDLIRKKTEHHDGLLEDLEEITLHQLNIEKLDTIGRVCPRLKILYLQNNLIGVIENIKRLKSLMYLNLALNNILAIPDEIRHCEKLRKLDLTVNFIDVDVLESSIRALQGLIHLDELYLTGNPCTTWSGYRPFVVHLLPKLEKLDGVDITRGERLQAKAAFAEVSASLAPLALAKSLERAKIAEQKRISAEEEAEAARKKAEGKDDDDEAEEKEQAAAAAAAAGGSSVSASASAAAAAAAASAAYAAKSQKVSAYTPESRTEMHREAEALELAKAAEKKASMKSTIEDPWKDAQTKLNAKVVAEGDVLPKQRNMGKWDFTMVDDAARGCIVVDISIQRFLDTSLIDLDVHPTWFQCLIKSKNLLLHFPAEVVVEQVKVQRIQATGHLLLTCPKVKKVQAITTTTTTAANGTSTSKSVERAEGDEKEAEDDAEEEAQLVASESAAASKSSLHTNVVDLSSSGSRAVLGGSSAFQRHNGGGGLNQIVSDYRHITKKKAPAAEAQMKEVAVTRSATLEEAHKERLQQAQGITQASKQASAEAERAELERLGLDDTGVPDLE